MEQCVIQQYCVVLKRRM